mmetsp:Transcript_10245/g.62612  ORF Transcript_10245/g.62612 Transcript_10245/m.62612 type:complete len:377 (+) Transcript_10245:481-1611(+)
MRGSSCDVDTGRQESRQREKTRTSETDVGSICLPSGDLQAISTSPFLAHLLSIRSSHRKNFHLFSRVSKGSTALCGLPGDLRGHQASMFLAMLSDAPSQASRLRVEKLYHQSNLDDAGLFTSPAAECSVPSCADAIHQRTFLLRAPKQCCCFGFAIHAFLPRWWNRYPDAAYARCKRTACIFLQDIIYMNQFKRNRRTVIGSVLGIHCCQGTEQLCPKHDSGSLQGLQGFRRKGHSNFVKQSIERFHRNEASTSTLVQCVKPFPGPPAQSLPSVQILHLFVFAVQNGIVGLATHDPHGILGSFEEAAHFAIPQKLEHRDQSHFWVGWDPLQHERVSRSFSRCFSKCNCPIEHVAYGFPTKQQMDDFLRCVTKGRRH